MKEQKRPKLSLKRKQSILPGSSETDTNTASINTFTSKKTHIIAKGDSSNQVSVVNTSCTSRSVCNKSNDGLQNVICISDDDDDKKDRPVVKKARHSSGTEERGNDSKMSNQASTFLVSRSGFLNVDNQDLKKLRESFLSHRNNKAVDIKSLRDLPCHQVSKTDDNSNNNGNRNSFNNEKSNNNENQNGLNNKIVAKSEDSNTNLNDMSNDYVTNVQSLSLLPPLCKWCRNRKPVSLHDQYPYEAFWSFDKNLPRDSSPIFNKSELTDKLMKTKESQKTERTDIISGEKETSRLNTDCNDVKSSFKNKPLFKNNKNFSTSNCTNVTEKLDVSCDSHIGRVVSQVSNKSQIQETTIELIKQKNLGTNKSYDVERHDSNAETRRNFGISTKMENTDVLKHDTKSAYFAEKRKDHVKTSGSSDEIMKPEFASKKSYDSCNDNRIFNDNDDNSVNRDKVSCNVSNDNNVEKDGSSEIETCPLCQTVFAKGMKQIDKDGHIAACFAASSDDVSW